MRTGIRRAHSLSDRARAGERKKEMQDVWSHPAFYLLIRMRRNVGLEDNLQSIGCPEKLPIG